MLNQLVFGEVAKKGRRERWLRVTGSGSPGGCIGKGVCAVFFEVCEKDDRYGKRNHRSDE